MRRLAHTVWVLAVITYIGDVILLFATDGWIADEPPPLIQAAEDLAFVLVATLALTVLRRQPNHAVGWWLMAAGLSFPLGGFLVEFTQFGSDRWGAIPLIIAVSWVVRWVWLLSSINIPFTLFLYPDGHLPSPRWRPVLWVMWILSGVTFLLLALDPGPLGEVGGLPNPLGVPGLGDTVVVLGPIVLSVMPVLGAVSLLARYRGAAPLEKQQIKLLGWVAGISVIFFGVLSFVQVGQVLNAFLNIAYTLFVASVITAGIIRYRLFDIDRLVSRTVSYSLVVAALVGVYAAVVGFLTQVLPLEGSISVAAATVAVAALFNPLRRRIQTWVDRRFNRQRYDAVATVDSFADRLRNEVDMGGVFDEFASVVNRTMQPASLSLWLREDASSTRNVPGTVIE